VIRDERRDLLRLQLEANPAGIDYDDIMADLGVDYVTAGQAVRDLRLWYFHEGDTITVVGTPQGKGQRWLFTLAGTTDAARPWVVNRLLDTESRLRTMHSVLGVLVNASDGRTVAGRKARRIERGLRHLVEDLDALDAGQF